MANLPREYLDGIAEFAAGVRHWDEWPRWFNVRAGRLVRLLNRSLFELLKAAPQVGVVGVLHEEGVTFHTPTTAAPAAPAPPAGPPDADEYAVYTALCRQLDLFRFDLPDTLFEDLTSGDVIQPPALRPRLEFDEASREYLVVRPGLAEHFDGPSSLWVSRHPEMLAQYESRNLLRWALQKRFDVVNGYRLVSELGEQEQDRAAGAFALSRVGFSACGQAALLFVRLGMACGNYLLFERDSKAWRRREVGPGWIT